MAEDCSYRVRNPLNPISKSADSLGQL